METDLWTAGQRADRRAMAADVQRGAVLRVGQREPSSDVIDVIDRSGWTDHEIGDLLLWLNAAISGALPPQPPIKKELT